VAKSSLFLFFASLLHSFNIEIDGNLPSLLGIDGISIAPKPYKVLLKKKQMVYGGDFKIEYTFVN
jgi:hypothetical protein